MLQKLMSSLMVMLTKILSKASSLFFAILCTLSILVLSLMSEVPQPGNVELNDKLGHFIAYLVLTFFWLIFAKYFFKNTINLLLVAIACISYGIIIEMMQHYLTATRTASVLDVLANTTGALLAFCLVFVVKIKVKR